MSVLARFDAACQASNGSSPVAVELLPVRLAQACADVLGVAGASIGLFSASVRIPLGASSDDADYAERLQFTLGQGPCLHAHRTNDTVLAGEADLARNWPMFHVELCTRTPYRSVLSLPLDFGPAIGGALDLYLTDPVRTGTVDLDDARAIADSVTANLLLAEEPSASPVNAGPAWLDSPPAYRRATVWRALGMLNLNLAVSTSDALALLRAYSFAHGHTVDEVAEAITTRTLPTDDLRA